MTRWIRQCGLVLAGLAPGPIARVLYRVAFGYRIDRTARIGFAYLDCERLSIGPETVIDHGVVFTRCGDVSIGLGTRIGPMNLFRGGTRIALGEYVTILRLNIFNAIPDHECVGAPDSSISLGRGAVVTQEHRLDFTDRITIGRAAIIAGRGTSMWTHNRRKSGTVEIGEYTYIGSESRLGPGSHVGRCCIVGMGAVVIKRFEEPYQLLAGVPVAKRRALTPDDYGTIFLRTRTDLPDDGYRPEAPPGSAAPLRFEDYY